MSTSSMLQARNNVSPARYCRVTYLALAGGLPSGAQNKPNARWFGCLQNPVKAVVLLPGKQHKWKGAQEVRNGSKTEVSARRLDASFTPENGHR
jgi:hypothetical protein